MSARTCATGSTKHITSNLPADRPLFLQGEKVYTIDMMTQLSHNGGLPIENNYLALIQNRRLARVKEYPSS